MSVTTNAVADAFAVFDVTPDPDELARKNKKPDDSGSVTVRQLYRYANWLDLILLAVGIFGSIGCGVLTPCQMLVMGDMVDTFNTNDLMKAFPNQEAMYDPKYYIPFNHEVTKTVADTINDLVLKMVCFAIGSGVGSFLMTFCFFVMSERQGIKIRMLYFRALLRQDAGWYDFHESGELTSRIASDVQQIQDGMSQKFGIIFQTTTSFIAGYAIGFAKDWDLTLVIMSMSPFIVLSMTLLAVFATKFTVLGEESLGNAGAIAEATIGNMRTVHSLGQEHEFCEMYNEKIRVVDRYNVLKGLTVGLGLGAVMFFIMGAFSLGSWYASVVLRGKGGKKNVTAGDVMIVFICVLIATQGLSIIAIPLNIFATAKASAYRIYQTIDRIPDIDCRSTAGECPTECNGNITLEDVQFRYPTRPTKQILGGLDLEIKKGQTVALVGASGCGKSTTIQLVQRNYDPVGGSVKLDGKDLRDLNIKWLRNQIGLVGQEPILFACTIRENIMLGARDGETPTEEEMIECAKMANAHEFISHLPEGYDTMVGEKGAALSGGQKQRIAIARALIRKPTILLLDEATSALDTQSEKIVQQALEKASQGRTTIVVAHRLTTVRNASRICVFHQGEIIEQGTHQELMDLKGTYYGLVKRQSMEEEVDQETVENDLKKIREQENKEAEEINQHKNTDTNEDPDIVQKLENEYNSEMKKLKHSNRFVLLRVILDNFRHEWFLSTFGFIGGIGGGAIFPFFTLKIVDLIMCLLSINSDTLTDDQKDTIKNICIIVVVIGVASFLSFFMYIGLFLSAGFKMIGRVRKDMYHSIMHQNISWFDRKENMVGSLTTRLASDPTTLQGISGERVGNVIHIISTIGFALGIAFYYDWKVSLAVMAVSPVLIVVVFINGKLNSLEACPAQAAYEKSGITLVEAVESVRTVQSLTREEHFYEVFKDALREPKIGIYKWAPLLSIFMCLTTLLTQVMNPYGFYIGTYLIKKKSNYDLPVPDFMIEFSDRFEEMQKAIMAVIFAAQAVGNLGNIVPDIGKAVRAAKNTYDVIDRKPTIDCYSEEGETFNDVKGEIEFKDICFRYPTRPDNSVLKGISFKVEQGKTVALVGASGCGKSTSVQLIERFYDPTHGDVLLDGHNIKDLNIHFLRSQIGMVGQEPVLFAESVMDNIRRGVPKGVEVSNEQIYAAAKMANAHDFISAMPEGYNTMVGDRGAQISGGQKQRIAIARALIRNPKVLLLDEATSALDSESEKIVQDALDKAAKGRTTIVIAHRLSTIQNADQICVIMRGRIAERGTHQELLDLKGFYYTLAMQQFGTVD
ncbi:p-glycoprotein 2 [Entamoeba histolytica]|uniref:Multidrug resistance protein 4 n=3 Tax=Entamoeba histolytica TaxID=5759 RepID=MDR4_ENTH1|nr:P-glycoprotein-2 [Entamoeba histolytica HM-1:IMSS]P16877.2 RecName: Full=Multidrug resistance protein 4; AltName: Full=P-glycoprotein [Entamoeba histolytica HM-1:IMSS]EAL43317.1 P-glycoprotein-2 [Entamoeba histolytica HM-1:IMSS]GAT92736.1 p-glycoprotein 2 [Entamoeba histolytica]|eukprot:XP_648704.1 P-glycoprotein-2 [Entamoeba histolytica HM-1:IMSS]